ncbi:hypothetical protein MBANPS3_011060 [Mucor bainieri]
MQSHLQPINNHKRRMIMPDQEEDEEAMLFGQERPTLDSSNSRSQAETLKAAEENTAPEPETPLRTMPLEITPAKESNEVSDAFEALGRVAIGALKDRFDTDPQYPYTIDPPELVIAFFTEFVFKRTYKKYVVIGSDVRTQIYLQDGDNTLAGSSSTLLTDAAPISKDRKSSIIEIPLSYESVNQYKKALMFLHEYQRGTRSITYPSPKKTKKIVDLIKEYE